MPAGCRRECSVFLISVCANIPVETNFLVPRAYSFSESWWLRNDRKETMSKLEMACVLTLFEIKRPKMLNMEQKTHE